MEITFLLTLALLFASKVASDMYTMPLKVQELFRCEWKIINELSKLETEEKSLLQRFITKYIENHKELHDLQDFELALALNEFDNDFLTNIVGNPVFVFRMFRRMVEKLPKVIQEIEANENSNKKFTTFLEKYYELKKTAIEEKTWPSTDDVTGSAISIGRIQSTYNLDPWDIAHGVLNFKVTKAFLTFDDCFFIAKTILERPMELRSDTSFGFASAIEWLETALRLINEEESRRKETLKQVIEEALINVRTKHDHFFRPPNLSSLHLWIPSNDFFVRKIGSDLNVSGRSLRREEETFFDKQSSDQPPLYNYREYLTLCRGKPLNRSDKESLPRKPTHCFLETHGDPYLALMPLKVEILLEEPFICLYHNLVSDGEIDEIKRVAAQKLARATVEKVHGVKNGERTVTSQRTQASAWLEEDEESAMGQEAIEAFARKLELASNLEVVRRQTLKVTGGLVESEKLQVGVYSPGGLYMPHHDSPQRDIFSVTATGIPVGNRIATAMLYMSDDVVGGGTAFPKLGVVAFPKKGSIVFWYNLKKDGSLDPLMMHGACPTIHGIKWVANKWIRQFAQTFRRPCGLKQG